MNNHYPKERVMVVNVLRYSTKSIKAPAKCTFDDLKIIMQKKPATRKHAKRDTTSQQLQRRSNMQM